MISYTSNFSHLCNIDDSIPKHHVYILAFAAKLGPYNSTTSYVRHINLGQSPFAPDLSNTVLTLKICVTVSGGVLCVT